MSKNICILEPRLDIPFKNLGPVSSKPNYNNLPPIRQHWANFTKTIAKQHRDKGDHVDIICAALWQLTNEHVNAIGKRHDIIYMPHKQDFEFPITTCEPRYYMQTVFPWLFTVDKDGWGSNLSYIKDGSIDKVDWTRDYYSELQKEAFDHNTSKFKQPPRRQDLPFAADDYILFVCQIPHDETIKQYSDVSVKTALLKTIEFADKTRRNLIVKGHPANPGSMHQLENTTKKYNHTWVQSEYSIHDLIADAESVFTVNSGTGFEAMLHNKPVFTFGEAEYDSVAWKFHDGQDFSLFYNIVVRDLMTEQAIITERYKRFINQYCTIGVDTRNHDL